MRNVTVPNYTCTGAQLVCSSRGYEYVGCREGVLPAPHSAEVTCAAPSTGERFQKAILSGVLGAAVGAGIGYAIRGQEGMWPAAAMCGALGLLFGDYV